MEKYPESHEDYIKAIYLISKNHKGGWVSNGDISDFLNIKPPSVSKMLYKLKENDLIEWQPRKSIRLTREGRKLAEDTVNNYTRLFNFFKNTLKIGDKTVVQEICCKMEHLVTPEVNNALDNLYRKAET
jgi:DtxR family Mn-dependent transcriptional regulator